MRQITGRDMRAVRMRIGLHVTEHAAEYLGLRVAQLNRIESCGWEHAHRPYYQRLCELEERFVSLHASMVSEFTQRGRPRVMVDFERQTAFETYAGPFARQLIYVDVYSQLLAEVQATCLAEGVGVNIVGFVPRLYHDWADGSPLEWAIHRLEQIQQHDNELMGAC